ncbi:OsmC family protein [Herpetosiphon sp. NSE202]|uniref:OsmC family protein n=1 Tax=Herpetosiphon sp. NSE202 TaxID=3351349 RepID=UPI00363C1C7E
MRIFVTQPNQLDLIFDGQAFGYPADLNPVQLQAAALVGCTAAVMERYAETAELDLTGTSLIIRWSFGSEPRRIDRYAIEVSLPAALTEARQAAVLRAAQHCTVHATLEHPPVIEIRQV